MAFPEFEQQLNEPTFPQQNERVLNPELLGRGIGDDQGTFPQLVGNTMWWVVRTILVNNLLFIAFDMACGTLMGWFGAMLGLTSKKTSCS